MALVDAVIAAGAFPTADAPRAAKKRYAEVLSQHLAFEVAASLRDLGFAGVKPDRGGPGERAFQGGLGPKKDDVSFADVQHGLLLAVSIKTIPSAPYGKNLKNRFYDLCPEGITLHLRFPYAFVCALFCLPSAADADRTAARKTSTFERAKKLLSTIAGRQEYTDPGEKFENVTMLLFEPMQDGTAPWVKLFDAASGTQVSEEQYFECIRQGYNRRNPHGAIGDDVLELDEDNQDDGEP